MIEVPRTKLRRIISGERSKILPETDFVQSDVALSVLDVIYNTFTLAESPGVPLLNIIGS